MLHSLKHYKVLHQKNVVLTIENVHAPHVDADDRVQMHDISNTFSRITLRFGFMETPNVPRGADERAGSLVFNLTSMSTSFFLSRRSLRAAPHSFMPRWQDRLFIGLSRSANDATEYFQIPTERVVEVGTQVTI